MIVLKNRNDPEMSKANFRARLCHSEQQLKNIHPMMLVSFLFADEKTFTVTTSKTQNDRLYAHPSTKKKTS